MSDFVTNLTERYLREYGWVKLPNGYWQDPQTQACYELDQAELTQRLRDEEKPA